jgi:FKBP-type peptidyl-prolyl cis-trans isomerase
MTKASAPIRSFFVLLALGGFLMVLGLAVRYHLLSRNDLSAPMSAAMRETLGRQTNELTAEDESEIETKFPGAKVSATGLRFIVRAFGAGAPPQPGDIVTVRLYQEQLLDGTDFDRSVPKGNPLDFAVGEGQVIKGWDEAFLGMKKGEKRTLIVPSWLAYGAEGKPPVIPPHATVVFEVELMDIRRKG